MKYSKKIGFGIVIALLVVMIMGCGKAKEDSHEGYQMVVDHYASFLLKADQNSALYDEFLLSVDTYTEDSTLENYLLILEKATSVLKSYQSFLKDGIELTLSDELIKALESCEIDPEEYRIVLEMDLVNFEDNILSIEKLVNSVELHVEGISTDEDLLKTYELEQKVQQCLNEYYYISINYWFAPLTEDELLYVEEKLLSQLQSYKMENYYWEQDRKKVEEKGNICLDQYEKYLAELAKIVGRQQELLYEMEEKK